ncbi:unnamed protein product, partial [Amoebophrya sp. A120]|eukprot:GSA120T00011647001.1
MRLRAASLFVRHVHQMRASDWSWASLIDALHDLRMARPKLPTNVELVEQAGATPRELQTTPRGACGVLVAWLRGRWNQARSTTPDVCVATIGAPPGVSNTYAPTKRTSRGPVEVAKGRRRRPSPSFVAGSRISWALSSQRRDGRGARGHSRRGALPLPARAALRAPRRAVRASCT